MAIDISQDLTITLLATGKSTPTITGVYDIGNPPDTYVPGKDYGATDNVSIGTTVQYDFSIAFDSLSNQLYTLDKVYIQSLDDPKTDGTGTILGYWINTDPDPTNITDDGQNTLIAGYNSSMTSIVFDSSANIKSDSTLSTGISVTLPFYFWWKSKIMPQIRVVAVKDGIEKISAPLQLDTVRLSTAANLVSTLGTNTFTYTTQGTQTGFILPLYIATNMQSIANITRMLNNPEFDLITYQINISAQINGTTEPLTTANFSISGENIVSYSYSSGVLTIVASEGTNSAVIVTGTLFLPFNPGTLTEATVTLSGTWHTPLPTITNFINGYLFTQYSGGNLNSQQTVVIVPHPPIESPMLREIITGNLMYEYVNQSLTVANYPCLQTQDSVFIRLVDSQLTAFSNTVTPTIVYYDLNQQIYNMLQIPTNSYTALYAYYAFPTSYDANTISQQVLSGAITLQTYTQVVNAGNKPNILAVTFTQDVLAGLSVDFTKPIVYSFDGNLDTLTQAEFKALYDSNPKNTYPSSFYSYMSLNTCYANVSDAYTAIGGFLYSYPTVDSITIRNNDVFLNLGTTTKNGPSFITRFNVDNIVEVTLPFDTVDATIQYSLFDRNDAPISVVYDYTKEYCFSIRWGYIPFNDNVFSTIPAGTVITVTLPNALAPYLLISDIPSITIPVDGGAVIHLPITNYSLSGNILRLTIPVQLSMRPNDICVPVKFLIPSANLTTNWGTIGFSKPLIYTQDVNSLIFGFDTTTLLFTVNTYTNNFTLSGAEIDTTGLFVSPNIYERGQSVTYVATVYNNSFSPSSNYCMSMTVPTNKYNPVQSSNNALTAYITGISLLNSNTVLYFQIEPDVTPYDIYIMKTINRPGGPTLNQYFDTTIVNTWIHYTGQTLPNNVVMMVACTNNVLEKSFVRVDYDVRVDVPAGSDQLYINDAVFNYYSSGSNLEAQSNMVSIQNRIAEALPILKTPTIQSKPLLNGTPVSFVSYFNAPTDNQLFTNFTFTDQLQAALAFDAANTTVVAYPNTIVAFTTNFNSITNTLTIDIPNSPATAGNLLVITVATIVSDTSKIPTDPIYNYPIVYNTAELIVNNNPNLKSTSAPVLVIFYVQPPTPITINKAPLTQMKPLVNGTPIIFTASFTAPSETRQYESFQIIDILPASLSFDTANSNASANGVAVAYQYTLDSTTNTVIFTLNNTALTAGNMVTVTIATILSDITKVPSTLLISNSVDLTANDLASTNSTSNSVTVTFINARDQAVNDLIESVALEQAALSHILNAEGEKLQKLLTLEGISSEMITKTNCSVAGMVHSISMLEMVLQGKLALFENCLCQHCSENI